MPNHFPFRRVLFAVLFSLFFSLPSLLAQQRTSDSNVAAVKRVPRPTAFRTHGGAIADAVKPTALNLPPVTIYYRSYVPTSAASRPPAVVTPSRAVTKPVTADLSPVIISYRVYTSKPSTSPTSAPPADVGPAANVPAESAVTDQRPISASPESVAIKPPRRDYSYRVTTMPVVSAAGDLRVEESKSITGTSSESVDAGESTFAPPPPPAIAPANPVSSDARPAAVAAPVAADPGNVPSGAIEMNNSAVELTLQSRYDEATDLLQKAIARSPEMYKFHRNLSIVYEHQLRLDEALASAQRAVQLAPAEPAAVAQLCSVKLMMMKDAEAVECYRDLSDLTSLDVLMQTSYGVALLRTGKPNDAIPLLEKAAAAVPPATATLNALGIAYFYVKRYPEALAAFKSAVEIDPLRGELRYNLGIAQLANRNKEGALSQYRMLRDQDAKLAEQLYGLVFADKIVSVEHLRR